MKTWNWILLGVGIAAAGLAPAAGAGPAAKSAAHPAVLENPPPPEVSTFDFFSGRWGCAGGFLGLASIAPYPTEAGAWARADVGGYWRTFHYDERRTQSNSMPTHVAGFWGYDSAAKQFIQLVVDNSGGYLLSTAPAWTGDSIVFTGEAHRNGHGSIQRDTFAKKGPGAYVHTGEIQDPDGKWVKLDEETCRKSH